MLHRQPKYSFFVYTPITTAAYFIERAFRLALSQFANPKWGKAEHHDFPESQGEL
jgi:hypothetical protein